MSVGSPPRNTHMDLVFVGITLAFFALSWGFVRLAEKVGES